MDDSRIAARIARVDEHIRCENAHDLAGILATVGPAAEYEDVPWLERSTGLAGVQTYYTGLLTSVPDLQIEVLRRHVAGDTIVVEVTVRGTHLGPWRGLPATGRRVEFPLCGIFEFDGGDRIAGERIYYDRATSCGSSASSTSRKRRSASCRSWPHIPSPWCARRCGACAAASSYVRGRRRMPNMLKTSSSMAIVMITSRGPTNPNRWLSAVRNSTVARNTVIRT